MTSMLSGWEKRHLRDVVHIKHGFAFKGEHIGTNGPYVLMTPGNFFEEGGFKRNGDKQKRYSGAVPREYILPSESLVVAMTEQAEGLLGSAAFIPDDEVYLHNQRIGLVTSESTDIRFLYYLLNTRAVRQQIRASSSGTKVRHTSPSRIGEVTAWLPPLAIQSRIANVLSAYDDLIEVSQRRIAILEDMARRLFDEWFVRFRYPGRDEVGFIDELPTGWAKVPLSEIAKFKRGKQQLTKKAYTEKGFVAFSASGPDGFLESWEVDEKAVVVSGVGAYCGKTWLARDKWTCIANTFYLLPIGQNITAEFLYLITLGVHFWPRRGAAQPFISTGDAGAIQVTLPPQSILIKFNQAVVPILDQIAVLERTNTSLRAARDLLLPKLVSGQIGVSATEETFAQAAE